MEKHDNLDQSHDDKLNQLQAIYEDGTAEINGNDYTFLPMKHKQRRKVLAYFTFIQPTIKRGDFSFLESEQFQPIEKVIESAVTFDGVQLSKREDHWDKHPADYLKFITVAMGVISYPFLSAGAGN